MTVPISREDEELVVAIRAGDERAFATRVDRHSSAIQPARVMTSLSSHRDEPGVAGPPAADCARPVMACLRPGVCSEP
jgi:hypothetical protein